jgi:hypothetical protein
VNTPEKAIRFSEVTSISDLTQTTLINPPALASGNSPSWGNISRIGSDFPVIATIRYEKGASDTRSSPKVDTLDTPPILNETDSQQEHCPQPPRSIPTNRGRRRNCRVGNAAWEGARQVFFF